MGALFGYRNAVDMAAISAGSEAGDMRSYNLADPQMQRRWRSLDTTSYFLAVFQEVSEVAFLALAGATLGTGDSIRHRLYDGSGVVVMDVSVAAGVNDLYGLYFHRLTAPLSDIARWRCDITAASRAAQGWFDIARAWAGPSWEPAIGIAPGFSNGPVDQGGLLHAPYSGASFNSPGAMRRIFDFSLDFMSEADRDACEAMLWATGNRNQMFFVPFYEADPARQAILGRNVSQTVPTESNNTAPPTYSQKFRIEQDI